MKLRKFISYITSPPFDFSNPPFDPIEYSHELVKLMRDSAYLALSSPEVDDSPYRIFALRGVPNIVCFNPRIVFEGEKQAFLDEISPLFGTTPIRIKRYKDIRVRYQSPNGETETRFLTGLSSRYFQQGMDHLEGITPIMRANRYHREKALKRKGKKN